MKLYPPVNPSKLFFHSSGAPPVLPGHVPSTVASRIHQAMLIQRSRDPTGLVGPHQRSRRTHRQCTATEHAPSWNGSSPKGCKHVPFWPGLASCLMSRGSATATVERTPPRPKPLSSLPLRDSARRPDIRWSCTKVRYRLQKIALLDWQIVDTDPRIGMKVDRPVLTHTTHLNYVLDRDDFLYMLGGALEAGRTPSRDPAPRLCWSEESCASFTP